MEHVLSTSETNVRVVGVDPFYPFGDDPFTNVSGGEEWYNAETQYRKVQQRLSLFGNRSVLLRLPSIVAARHLTAVDLVFVDGDHHGDSVRQDIQTWTAKLRPGGIIGGHDYSRGWRNDGSNG
eukprot:CAMPEP_0204443962 /NCGR_PEP_ID=MMETSP0470-20130426/90188_1 /ASSEMBLY_ACC=CAM_ASM_000385 /TAXON_ID=2969 /ORGANISM="Oxyrrhis marina" /LENGTH=122 /DNA_ID=CAMNT_0051443305 /DNA_START=523 /DNA_END=887 /DNA_ORIENTATION=-